MARSLEAHYFSITSCILLRMPSESYSWFWLSHFSHKPSRSREHDSSPMSSKSVMEKKTNHR